MCVCVCVCHIFFICLSVPGHLGCFHVLAIINSAAMNTELHASLGISFFWIYIPRNGIAGSYGNSFFFLKGTSILFSILVIPIYIPTNTVGEFPFLHTPSSIYYLYTFLLKAILTSVRWCLMICISLIISNVEHLCMCLLIICVSFGEMFKASTRFFIQLVSIVVIE